MDAQINIKMMSIDDIWDMANVLYEHNNILCSSQFFNYEYDWEHVMCEQEDDEYYYCYYCDEENLTESNYDDFCTCWYDKISENYTIYDYAGIEDHYRKLNDAVRDYYKNNITTTILSANDIIDEPIIDMIHSLLGNHQEPQCHTC
jgi:hypothetical protein